MRSDALLTFLLAVSTAATGDCPHHGPGCDPATGWNELESIRLRMTIDGSPLVLNSYLQESRLNNDLRIDVDVADPKHAQHGTILMVAGTAMVTRGLALTPGQEIDAVDGPLLYSMLVGKALGRALPGGPAALKGPQPVGYHAATNGLSFATPSANFFIPPPWSLSGSVTPQADHAVAFDLIVTWSEMDAANAQRPTRVSLQGDLKHETEFHLDDSMALDGWSVYEIGPIVASMGAGTTVDYGAKPLRDPPRTIGELRRRIALENAPGQPTPSLRLAGFWKIHCTDGFGLRVRPTDPAGMYTVTFCGPGGCGEEGSERKTFITGDRHYRVLSAAELEVGPEGNRSRYTKCSEGMVP